MQYRDSIDIIVRVLELAGVAVLVAGFVVATALAIRGYTDPEAGYTDLRRRLGRSLMISLEILVAADIVQTVALDLTLENIITLGLLVVVRTVLSLSISIEVEGVLPWHRAQLERSKL
jgi:uncharacterized membrane protein